MDVLSFVIVGHVDHGKSTLIGRLLYETNSIAPDRLQEVQKISAEQGRQTEFAYLLDHLEEERTQGITIDTTQVFFKTDKRRYVIIDAPGHVEFVRNMITGATQAEAAVLIVDAAEGVREQTRRHSYMLSLLGLKQVIVVLNKMDLVDFSEQTFNKVRNDISQWLSSVGIEPLVYIPIAAFNGDNITKKSDRMPWYTGPAFLQSLDSLVNRQSPLEKSLLLPVQDVYKIDDKRINAGRIESGRIQKGQTVTILPEGTTTTIASVEKFLADVQAASTGECIGFTTSDSVFLERGCVVCTKDNLPAVTDTISARIFWMAKKGCSTQDKLSIRCATRQTSCRIEQIIKRINSSTLQIIGENSERIENLEVAQVIIKTKKPLVIKSFGDVQELGRFVLVHDDNIVAGGIIN